MTTFIKTKLNKSDDQTNIDNIEQLQILQNIKIHGKKGIYFMEKMYVKMSKINKYKLTYGLFGHNYRVAAFSTLYLLVFVFIITSLKSIGQF